MNQVNKTKKMVFISLLILFLVTFTGFAKQGDEDFESWSSITLEYKPDKKWTFGVEGELRLKDNASLVDQYFGQLNIGYRLSKRFELGAGVRYIRNNDTRGKIQGYENHFRYHLDLSYRHRLGPLSFKHRVRYQSKNELGVSVAEGDYANRHIRFKTRLTYNIKRWKLDPVFSTELFYHVQEDQEAGFDKYRLTIGTNYKHKRLGKIGLFYRMEQTLNDFLSIRTHILMVKYTYVF